METVSTNRSHGGTLGVYRHESRATGTGMNFSVFVPDGVPAAKCPVLWFLSGLTCSHANVTEKGEYRRACAEAGLIFVAPDTSPRGDAVPDDDAIDLGTGASFYVDATRSPWSANYRMASYIEDELPALIAAEFPADMDRQGITGHSMGGHGALIMALRNPGRFRSVSALAPIVAPSLVPWGRKAFSAYLGDDEEVWRRYDACALIEDGARLKDVLIDQGDADQFRSEQLRPQLFDDLCRRSGVDIKLRMQPGYDHSYYFVSSFLADHVAWAAERLHR